MSDSNQARKRQKKTWVLVDTGEKSVDEYAESTKKDICLSHEVSGKIYCKYKYYYYFRYKQVYCTRISEGVKVLETASTHACSNRILEKRARHLLKHDKEKAEAKMTKQSKITP